MSIRPVDAIRMRNGRKRAFVRGHPMSDDLSLDLEDLEFACIWLAPVGARCRFRPSEGRFLVQAPYKRGLLGAQNGVQSPFWHRSHRRRGACECIKNRALSVALHTEGGHKRVSCIQKLVSGTLFSCKQLARDLRGFVQRPCTACSPLAPKRTSLSSPLAVSAFLCARHCWYCSRPGHLPYR